MSSLSLCTELAANLSTSYLNPAIYDGVSSLADFLSFTGVLLSMCVAGNCTTDVIARDDSTNKHLSGSWIQDNTTGPRVFGVNLFGMETGIGMVLDPQQVEVLCIYPLDGVSDMRTDYGCGTINAEVPWWQKQVLKAEIYWKKMTKFFGTKWDDIPCSQILDFERHGRHMGPMVVGMVDHKQTWKTMYYFLQELVSGILGHVVCYDDTVPDFSNDKQMLTYFGPDSWMPSEWNENSAIIQNVIQEHPTSQGIWNEIVMAKVDVEDYARVIQAMFYVDVPKNDTFQKLAHSEAKRLGVKHVLEFDPQNAQQGLFRCPNSAPPLEDVDVLHSDSIQES